MHTFQVLWFIDQMEDASGRRLYSGSPDAVITASGKYTVLRHSPAYGGRDSQPPPPNSCQVKTYDILTGKVLWAREIPDLQLKPYSQNIEAFLQPRLFSHPTRDVVLLLKQYRDNYVVTPRDFYKIPDLPTIQFQLQESFMVGSQKDGSRGYTRHFATFDSDDTFNIIAYLPSGIPTKNRNQFVFTYALPDEDHNDDEEVAEDHEKENRTEEDGNKNNNSNNNDDDENNIDNTIKSNNDKGEAQMDINNVKEKNLKLLRIRDYAIPMDATYNNDAWIRPHVNPKIHQMFGQRGYQDQYPAVYTWEPRELRADRALKVADCTARAEDKNVPVEFYAVKDGSGMTLTSRRKTQPKKKMVGGNWPNLSMANTGRKEVTMVAANKIGSWIAPDYAAVWGGEVVILALWQGGKGVR